MGTEIVAYRKSKVQLKTREDAELQKEYVDSYQIWKCWRDSDVNSWPNGLQHFWWKIYDFDSAQLYAKKMREYYPKDIELLRFASWLETFDEDIIFELSI